MNNEISLFEDDWGEDNSPPDNTDITTTILYFSTEELTQFKKLCKKGMRDVFGTDVMDKGNLSDFLLYILNKQYGSDKTEEENTNHAS